MSQLNRKKLLVIRQILIRVMIIIAIVEFAIMQVLPYIGEDLTVWQEALLDTFLLSVISTPLIYYFVVSPFVIEHENTLEKISHMAYHDHLTGLANRRLLLEYFNDELSCNLKNDEKAAILALDLDGFKEINDVYGHDAGDCLLVEVSSRLKAITRSTDLVSRIGGDEFLILVKKFDGDLEEVESSVMVFANKIINELKEPICYRNEILKVSVSIGICIYDALENDFEKITKNADFSMYESKRNGKDQASIFREL